MSIQVFTVVTTAPRKLNIFQNSDSTDQVRNIAIFEVLSIKAFSEIPSAARDLYHLHKANAMAAPTTANPIAM